MGDLRPCLITGGHTVWSFKSKSSINGPQSHQFSRGLKKHRGFSEGFCLNWDDLRFFCVRGCPNWSWFIDGESLKILLLNSSNSALPIRKFQASLGNTFEEKSCAWETNRPRLSKRWISESQIVELAKQVVTCGKHHLSMRYQWWLIMFDIPICQNPWWLIMLSMMANNHLSMMVNNHLSICLMVDNVKTHG